MNDDGLFTLVVTLLDINKYMATFTNIDRHIPEMIADELNNYFSDNVLFAATRLPDRGIPLSLVVPKTSNSL